MRITGTVRIASRRMAPLVGARAGFRAATLAANVALVAAWGQDGYSRYAVAMGGAAFLIPASSLGIEKCALKLAPRTRGAVTRRLIGSMVALAALLLVVSLALLAVVLLNRGGPVAVPALAGLYAICTGGNQVLVGLSRAIDRPGRDVLNHVVLTAALALWTGAALLLHISVVLFLALYTATLAVLNLALLAGLRPDFSSLRRPRLVRAAVGGSALMAVADAVAGVSVSLLFLVLARTRGEQESTGLYLAFVASSTFMNAFSYLLRLAQPEVSRSLHTGDLRSLHGVLLRWLRRLLVFGTPYLLIIFATAHLFFRDLGGTAVVGLYAACVPVVFLMGSVNYLLENAAPAALRATAAGAVISLPVVGGLAVLVVPWAGALGAVAVLACGELVHAAAVLCWLGRTDPSALSSRPSIPAPMPSPTPSPAPAPTPSPTPLPAAQAGGKEIR